MPQMTRDQYIADRVRARAQFVTDVESGGGDPAILALERLRWFEESLKDSYGHKETLMRLLGSTPVIGNMLTQMLESIQSSMTEYGKILGLIRGLLRGFVLACIMFLFAEFVVAAHGLVREWITIHYTAPLVAWLRHMAVEENNDYSIEGFAHLGAAVKASTDLSIIRLRKTHRSNIDGSEVKFDEIAEWEDNPNFLGDTPERLDRRVAVQPFFLNIHERKSLIPFFTRSAHSDLATLKHPSTGAEFALATLDDVVILIPMDQYKRGQLPLGRTPPADDTQTRFPKKIRYKKKPAEAAPSDIVHAVIVHDSVPFVEVYNSKEQFNQAATDDDRLKAMTMWFREDGPYPPQHLSSGMRFKPFLKQPGDPASIMTVGCTREACSEQYLLVDVSVNANTDWYGLIPKAEYDAFLGGLK